MASKSFGTTMRVWHRYLGFFLAGIMAVYALSGIVMIFRNTDFLKKEKIIINELKPGIGEKELGQALRMRDLKIEKTTDGIAYFKQGTYNTITGHTEYTVKELPFMLRKMTGLHKSKSGDPLYFLNIFFGVSLFFFVLSSFWMFTPKSSIFKKGIVFALAGLLFTLLLIFV